MIKSDAPNVPTGPSPSLTPLESLDSQMQRLVAEARRLFEERPIWTRRAMRNHLPAGLWKKVGNNTAKFVFHYLAYSFSSGPWRDAFVKFSVDPRKDPKYRIYQTMMFQEEREDSPRSRKVVSQGPKETWMNSDYTSHLFDGKTVSRDCKSFQVCDITEPLVVSILSTDDLRAKCHVSLQYCS